MLQIKRGKSPQVPVRFDYILMTVCNAVSLNFMHFFSLSED